METLKIKNKFLHVWTGKYDSYYLLVLFKFSLTHGNSPECNFDHFYRTLNNNRTLVVNNSAIYKTNVIGLNPEAVLKTLPKEFGPLALKRTVY